MNADVYDPKTIKQMLLNVVLLDWRLIEDRYRKKWLAKRKKPIVLSPEQVEAQARLKRVSRRYNRLQKTIAEVRWEYFDLCDELKNTADNAMQRPQGRLARRRRPAVEVLPPEELVPDDPGPPSVVRCGALGRLIRARLMH
ncbi:MAG TPA: hypothetical protein VGI88_15440 [Verrucomicrobiae bacterium]